MNLIKRSLIAALTIFASIPAPAQQPVRTFGLHAGLSSFNVHNFVGDRYRTGLSAGIFLVQPVSRSICFQPELNFQMQGSKSSYTGRIDDIRGIRFNDSYRLNYLNMPLLISYHLPKTPLHIFAGPQPGLLLSASLLRHPQDYESIKTDIRGSLNKFALGGTYGVAAYLDAGNGKQLVFDGRFAIDFTHLNKSNGADYGKNYGFTFTIGYLF